ncbi:MAG TPA: hypothetical protein ENH82_00835 [bacterium]|nr:hypothetical protein [bacterium]
MIPKQRTVREILESLGLTKPVRCGNLKFVNLDCQDLAQHPIKRACSYLQRRFKDVVLDYLPKIDGDVLFVPEDVSPGKRALVKKAMAQGVTTVVIQHGIPQSPSGFVPLYADYFFCWREDWLKFMSWGIPKERLITFVPERPKNLKKLIGVDAVFFLPPPSKGRTHQLDVERFDEAEILEMIRNIKETEKNLIIKPHPKLFEYLKPHLENEVVIWESADDLIYSAKRIYCVEGCTIIKDVKMIWGPDNDTTMRSKGWSSGDVVFFSRGRGML